MQQVQLLCVLSTFVLASCVKRKPPNETSAVSSRKTDFVSLKAGDRAFFIRRNSEAKKLEVLFALVKSVQGSMATVTRIDSSAETISFDLTEALPVGYGEKRTLSPDGLAPGGLLKWGSFYKFSILAGEENSTEKQQVTGRVRDTEYGSDFFSIRDALGMIVRIPLSKLILGTIELLEDQNPLARASATLLADSKSLLQALPPPTLVYTQRVEAEAPYKYPTEGLANPKRKEQATVKNDAKLAFTISELFPLQRIDLKEGINYLYIVDRRGEIRLAPELQPAPEWQRALKHGDLSPAELKDEVKASLTSEMKSEKSIPLPYSAKSIHAYYVSRKKMNEVDLNNVTIGHLRGIAYAGGEAKFNIFDKGLQTERALLTIDASSSYVYNRTDRQSLSNWQTLEIIGKLFRLYTTEEISVEIKL